MKIAIVTPTIREEAFAEFTRRWRPVLDLDDVHFIVVEDNPERTFRPGVPCDHYCWADIDDELGDRSWIIPRRTDCVRSFGYLKAAATGADIIWTLDDDCYPEESRDPVGWYIAQMCKLFSSPRVWQRQPAGWWDTIPDAPDLPRGIPYKGRHLNTRIDVHHGLWSHVPDFDAMTQLRLPNFRAPAEDSFSVVPNGQFFPMCGMNLAFRPEVVPAMYFLLMGQGQPYDRFGDIWAGIFVKAIADHLGRAVTSGAPSVRHEKASDVWANLRKEAPGYRANEVLWHVVRRVRFAGTHYAACYRELATGLHESDISDVDCEHEYWRRLPMAMRIWSSFAEQYLATGHARRAQAETKKQED